MKTDLSRVRQEAQGRNVTVNGWQEGTASIPGFTTVTDKASRTTFAVTPGEPLDGALCKAQARMRAGADSRKRLRT